MKSIARLIQCQPLMAFFILTFAWTWLCWLPLLIATPPGGMQAGISPIFFLGAILGGFGPTLAGFFVTRLVNGKAGVKALWQQAGRWRLSLGWYAVALLTVPAISLLALFLNSALLGKPVDFSAVGSNLALGLIWPLFSSLGEEFGWRGFATPAMQKSRTPLAAALIVGLLWGLWHLPADFIGMRHYGWLFIPYFILAGMLNLTVQAVIMSWVYNRSNSLLPVILYHFSITSTAIILPALQLSALENILGNSISVALFSAVAVAVTLLSKPKSAPVAVKSA